MASLRVLEALFDHPVGQIQATSWPTALVVLWLMERSAAKSQEKPQVIPGISKMSGVPYAMAVLTWLSLLWPRAAADNATQNIPQICHILMGFAALGHSFIHSRETHCCGL